MEFIILIFCYKNNVAISITLPLFQEILARYLLQHSYLLNGMTQDAMNFGDIFCLTFLGKSLIGNEKILSILRSNN